MDHPVFTDKCTHHSALLHHVVKEPFFKKSYEWRYDRYFYFLHYNMFQPWCTHCTLYKGEVGFLSSCWFLQNLFFSSPIKRSLSLLHTLSHCTLWRGEVGFLNSSWFFAKVENNRLFFSSPRPLRPSPPLLLLPPGPLLPLPHLDMCHCETEKISPASPSPCQV